MKSFLFFTAGVIAGSALVLNEIAHERLLVENKLDGSVTMHYPGAFKAEVPAKNNQA